MMLITKCTCGDSRGSFSDVNYKVCVCRPLWTQRTFIVSTILCTIGPFTVNIFVKYIFLLRYKLKGD